MLNKKAQDIKDFHNSVNKLPSWLVNDVLYTVGDKIIIQVNNDKWDDKEGIILNHVNNDMFRILTYNNGTPTELLLYLAEFVKVEK